MTSTHLYRHDCRDLRGGGGCCRFSQHGADSPLPPSSVWRNSYRKPLARAVAASQLAQVMPAAHRFKDPFNDLQGAPAIKAACLQHVCFAMRSSCSFIVTQRIVQGDQAFWRGSFTFACAIRRLRSEQFYLAAPHICTERTECLLVLHRDYAGRSRGVVRKFPVLLHPCCAAAAKSVRRRPINVHKRA